MNKLVLFLKKIHVLLIFIVLEVVALNYYANSTSYTKAKLLTISNSASKGIYETASGVTNFFRLRKENRALTEEVAMLRNELAVYNDSTGFTPASSLSDSKYFFTTAKIINNSVTRQQNFFTLNKGMRDGVEAGMAVLSPNGVAVGYVLTCSENLSVCISILNTKFHTSGRIKGGEYGSIFWDGKDNQYVQMSEMSKYAEIQKGDTIVTTQYSTIFPDDMMIGTVESFILSESSAYYEVVIKLAVRMSTLNNVVLVKYVDAEERLSLERDAMGAINE